MSRYIDADKLQKDGWKLRREKRGLLTSTYETMELDCVQTADVRENVRGEWTDFSMSIKGVPTEACGVCGEWSLGMGKKFCPNCGADMRGGKT